MFILKPKYNYKKNTKNTMGNFWLKIYKKKFEFYTDLVSIKN